MRLFAQLYRFLSESSDDDVRIGLLTDYFNAAKSEDKVWAIALLMQKRPSRIATVAELHQWILEEEDLPAWLFEESFRIVGDLAETIAFILPNPTVDSDRTLSSWIDFLINLKDKDSIEKRVQVRAAWKCLDQGERFVFNKLLTGGFRLKVDLKILICALANSTRIDPKRISLRLMVPWEPTKVNFEQLVITSNEDEDLSRPFTLRLTNEMDGQLEGLGNPSDWMAERKWDGRRIQLIFRKNEYYLWSSDEEIITSKIPELKMLIGQLDKDFVIDGVILPFKDGKILSRTRIQSRLGRKSVTKKQLVDTPIVIMAFDILEYDGMDVSAYPLDKRKKILHTVIARANSEFLLYSDDVSFETWSALREERKQSRNFKAKGLVLKRKAGTYFSNRIGNDWLSWKAAPLSIDAVLLYVQRGRSGRSGPITELTFAVKKDNDLVTFAKVKPDLTEEEMEEIDRFAKDNTRERFGPVSSILPQLVFEILFDGISASPRHKSGVVLQNPRIAKWHQDRSLDDINSLQELHAFVSLHE